MNVLIGGTGFIGSALAKELVCRGEGVLSLSRGGRGDVCGVQYESCDTGDMKRSARLLEKGEDIFILTGQVGPNFSQERERRNLENIVAILKKFPEKRIFYASSAYVYGNTSVPADESYQCHPIEAYSQFKFESEQMLRRMLPRHRLIIFRIANVYGSPKNRGIVGLAMKKLFESDGFSLRVNGDGNQKRDYIFLDDVARALVSVKERALEPDTVNISFGESTSLLEVVAKISELSGQEIPIEVTGIFPDEIRDLYVSNKKLKDVYGYTPRITLEDGLQQTIKRYREHVV